MSTLFGVIVDKFVYATISLLCVNRSVDTFVDKKNSDRIFVPHLLILQCNTCIIPYSIKTLIGFLCQYGLLKAWEALTF